MRTDRTGEGSPPLILPGAAREALFREAESARPVECCGFLLGREDRRGRFVEEIRPARNRERSGRAFFIPPRVFWREEVRARRAGLVILGFYHSHPSDPPIPSREDLRLSWPGRSSLIVGGDRSIRSWIRRRGETSFREERIGGNAPRSLAPPEPAYEAPTIPAVPIVAGGAPE